MKNIYLIGYRCSGKTAVGKALARQLNRTFYDCDDEIVKDQGMTIADMVSRFGWDHFRRIERDTLMRLSRMDFSVIATGGGAVLDPNSVTRMKQSGIQVWLKASLDTLKDRLLNDTVTQIQRPGLTSKGTEDEIEDVLRFRTPIYESAADIIVETDSSSIDDLARKISDAIG